MSTHESLSVIGVPPAPSLSRRTREAALARASLGVAATAFAAVLVSHLIDFGADDLRVALFNAESDGSWSHVLTAVVVVGATLITLAGARRVARHASLWTISAAILAFISVDEISSLHARIDAMSWGKLVYAPILAVLCVCLWRLSDRTARSLTLRAGIVTLIVSFGIHVFGPHIVSALGFSQDSWLYQIKVGLKQGTESAGWILVLLGLARQALTAGAAAA